MPAPPYHLHDFSSSSDIFMILHLLIVGNCLFSQIRCKVKTFSTISSINSQKILLFAANLLFLLTFLQEYARNGREIVAIAFGSSKENLYLCQQITEERKYGMA